MSCMNEAPWIFNAVTTCRHLYPGPSFAASDIALKGLLINLITCLTVLRTNTGSSLAEHF